MTDTNKKPLKFRELFKTKRPNQSVAWYRMPDGRLFCSEPNAEELAKYKRFTLAELSAEFWRSFATREIRVYKRDPERYIYGKRGETWEYEYAIIQRFATLPSYDEE